MMSCDAPSVRLSPTRDRFVFDRRAGSRGQSMIEFALVSPLLFLMVFLLIDFGRLVYIYSAMSNAAKEGARTVSLVPQENTDCVAMKRMEAVSQGFVLTPDPHSVYGNLDATTTPLGTSPTGPMIPPAGRGYFYIWPAVAQSNAAPVDVSPNCDLPSNASPPNRLKTTGSARNVEVQVSFRFVPLSPIVAGFIPSGGITLQSLSYTRTEY